MDSLSEANGNFAFNLFNKLNQDNKENMFYSPLSISSVLAMVCLGARKNTAAQMSQVLQLDKRDDVHTHFQSLILEMNKPGTDYILKAANRLYGEKSYSFLEEFLGATQKYYYADLQSVDFLGKAEGSRQEINDWVKQKTEGRIKDLLQPGTVDSLTRLVLVNAIYFKGNWENSFNLEHTREMPFRLSKNRSKAVQMMYQTRTFPMTYIGELFTKVIELPYVNNELSMIFMLPDDIEDGTTGLEKLEMNLTYDKFLEWTNPEMMDETKMELFLPKFKLEANYDLKSVLISMGMTDAFCSNKADFSGMSDNNDLFLSKIIHKSYVDVNEEGTEAAATTAAVMENRCLMIVPRIVCDHPFLFFIVHRQSRSILFCGRVVSP
ncbi:hypothetical protein GDO86_011289 [Hymenochirus boettgeri]|uniref:Leukocyte elastase inhibitor n=1 Tax=Hymenochirus boettgeri TaxID=247094 RepID=A0A8T2JB08_9PIPI|nr:hypothetical protein GDO86_011289 [Hymenochirus boettgeri]